MSQLAAKPPDAPAVRRGAGRSLSAQLLIAFVAAIVATTGIAGLPAYWLVRTQLEQQARARVSDGGRVTQALLETEQARLMSLVDLTSQRPTLQAYLLAGDTVGLSQYLREFRANTELDLLIVHDASGQLLLRDARIPEWDQPPLANGTVFWPLPGSHSGLALLAGQPVRDEQSGQLLGYVAGGVVLDDGFAKQLAAETGFEQTIIHDGVRIATSLPDTPPMTVSETTGPTAGEDRVGVRELRIGNARYYATLIPIHNTQGEVVAVSEVALPVDDLLAAERRALLNLIMSTLLVVAVGSAMSGLYSRRLTAPLRQLTLAATRISQGDLITPMPVPRQPVEIAALARTLEESRISTRRTLDNLSRAKAWSESLIQSIVEGVVAFDARERITFFSQGAEHITGWASDEAVGKGLNQVFRVADDGGQFTDYIPPYGVTKQISIETRKGRPTTLTVTGPRPVPADDGSGQIALVLRDITEEEASRHLRSYFLGNVSHEFRTPLSALNASVELLLEEAEYRPVSEVKELLNSIHLSVVGLQTLIDNLLESTSIEAGHFSIRRCPTAIGEVVEQAIQVMQPLLNRRQQDLSLVMPEHLPLLNADPTRLVQVMVNLLSNASKYSPMGQTIDLRLEVVKDNLRVAMSDRGRGIPRAERENLFRRFVRLGNDDGTQYGIGLGLSVVKAIVKEHGGAVGVDDRPGGGSVFWFTLPLRGA